MAPVLTVPHPNDNASLLNASMTVNGDSQFEGKCPLEQETFKGDEGNQTFKTNKTVTMMVSQELDFGDEYNNDDLQKQESFQSPPLVLSDSLTDDMKPAITPLRRSPRKKRKALGTNSPAPAALASSAANNRQRRKKKGLPRKSIGGNELVHCLSKQEPEDSVTQPAQNTTTSKSNSNHENVHTEPSEDHKAIIPPPQLRRSPRKRKSLYSSPSVASISNTTISTKAEPSTTTAPPTKFRNHSVRTSIIEKSDDIMMTAGKEFLNKPSVQPILTSPSSPDTTTKSIATIIQPPIATACQKAGEIVDETSPHKSIALFGGERNKENDTIANVLASRSRSMAKPTPILKKSSLKPIVSSNQPAIHATIEDLEERMSTLFPSSNTALMPCVASRLFACYTLHRNINNDSSMQLLGALVELEMMLLRDHHSLSELQTETLPVEDSSLTPTYPQKKVKKVHFAAFDGSSMRPPTDVLEGSYSAQQDCIDHLTKVQQICNAIRGSADTDGENSDSNTRTIDSLRSLAQFLTTESVSYHTPVANSLSQTMPLRDFSSFPVGRVQKAASSFAHNIEYLCDGELTQWDYRLADASAQLCRYWLRTVLNPVPDRALTEYVSQEWISRVCEIIHLQSDKDHVATDDESLSALVSEALSNVYHYVGGDANTDGWAAQMNFPTSFCQSELCLRGIRKSNQQDFVGHDWTTLGYHVQVAISYLAAINSVQFLYDLLTIVVAHPSHLDYWKSTIQFSGRQLAKAADGIQSQDEHLVLLSIAPEQLLKVLQPILVQDDVKHRRQACFSSLQALAKTYVLQEPKSPSPNKARGKGKSRYFQLRNQIGSPLAKLQDYYQRTIPTIDFPTLVERNLDFE